MGISHIKMGTSDQRLSHLFKGLGAVVSSVTGTKFALL